MALETLDRTPPPFFRQGASALSRLIFFSALALFLMVADTRFRVVEPVRTVIASVIYPLQWAVIKPLQWAGSGWDALQELVAAKEVVGHQRELLHKQTIRLQEYEQMALENSQLRALLDLRPRLPVAGIAAQVLYDAADPYVHKVVIDKGLLHGVEAGAAVIDEGGLLGQVTHVHAAVSEVTLVIDANQAVPIVNTRTGIRAVVFGVPDRHGGMLDLRYMGASVDVQPGDLLSTSGIDGIFPAGLPVARVRQVARRPAEPFAQIDCVPLARVTGASQVLVLPAVAKRIPARPASQGNALSTPRAAP